MKLVVLTTQTTHHSHFVRELKRIYDDIHVMIETKSIKPQFSVAHPFEKERDEYELNSLFSGKDVNIADFTDCSEYKNINDEAAINRVKALKPDAIVVFGTGIIRSAMIDIMNQRIINLHGGDPEYYRGLDSHLWAIYHKDFDQLITTIHHVNRHLDDGRVIMKHEVPIYKGMKLYQLRKNNTDVCIKLAQYALDIFLKEGIFPSIKQKVKGRYYSFMPDVIKDICVKNFEQYTEKLQ